MSQPADPTDTHAADERRALPLSGPTLFTVGSIAARTIEAADVPALQRFFDANPEYFRTINGVPPAPNEAQQELDDLPPAGMAYTGRWTLGFVDPAGTMAGMAGVLADFLAPRVWHVGLFIVASALHGRGVAFALYAGLETWMRANGAEWVRLGVVDGNAKGERFWARAGYVEVRQRHGVLTGARTNTIRVLVKPLCERPLAEYLAGVPRDRPDSTLS